MFDRSLVKKESLNHLRHNWKFPLFVTAVTGFLSVCFNAKDLISSLFSFELSSPSVAGFIWFFMSPVLSMASRYFYLSFVKTREKTSFTTFLEGLNLWIKGILSFLYVLAKVILWSALLIIPGFIKALSYSMTTCILAENPSLEIKKAVKLSMLITKGYLFDIFMFYVSFAGWFIIMLLTGGLFGLWLAPYLNTASTFVYLFLKETALESGTVTHEDFEA